MFKFLSFQNFSILETSDYFPLILFTKVKNKYIRHYKAIILIFPILFIYKFCKEEIFIQLPGETTSKKLKMKSQEGKNGVLG